jgi:chromosome segregation protein
MALLKKMLGNSSKDRELADDVRAALAEMREERERFERLLESSQGASERLAAIDEPVTRLAGGLDEAVGRLAEVEGRLAALSAVAGQVDGLAATTTSMSEAQKEAQAHLETVVADAERIRTVFEELAEKTDLAEGLRGRLEAFLEIEKPFTLLRGEAEAIRGQIEGTTDQLGRLREQHDRLMDAHKLATSKMEALDRRREELSRDLTDKERRVVDVERAVKEMDGLRQGIADGKRQMGSLKSLADQLSQKTATLEAQREAVDRALAQADQLERAIAQVEAGTARQLENEKSLALLQDKLTELTSLHESVLERSSEIGALQAESAQRITAIHDDLDVAKTEARNAVERFDFESKGLESTSHRVADLRTTLADFEGRFRGLREASETVRDLSAKTSGLVPAVEDLRTQVARIEEDRTRLDAMRRDLDEAVETTHALGADVARVVEGRPAIDTALAEFERLAGSHAMVKDALEQAKNAHAEIGRMIAVHGETRTWLLGVERTLAELRTRFGALDQVVPGLERVERQAARVAESIESIEARRDFLEDLHGRLAECASVGSGIDERSKALVERMDVAEERFVRFAGHAEEADRLGATIADVNSGVSQANAAARAAREAVDAIEARCASIDELASRTRTLKDELDQRQSALETAARELERATTLRAEATEAAESLGELATSLGASLSQADQRATALGKKASDLERRAGTLGTVDRRIADFEQRLARWEVADQQVTRTLEQIAARQGTIQSLQADLDRMFALAETTCEHVRTITTAQRETAESRALLDDVRERLETVVGLAGTLEGRELAIVRAEERLARAESFLDDVRSGMETLSGQRTLVDQAVEKVSSLRFLLKQADAMIEGLRDERRMTSEVEDARDEADDEGVARAA